MPNSNTYACVTLPENLVHSFQNDIIPKIQLQYPNFKPQYDLHMTFIYLGDSLRFKDVKNYVTIINEIPKHDWEFTFSQYDLFPPGKQNLIVGLFTSPENLVQLRNQVVSKIGAEKLKDEDPYLWIPHITLGKLVGKKQNNIKLNFPSPPNFTSSELNVINPYFL